VQLDLQAPLLAQMRPFVEAHERTLHASATRPGTPDAPGARIPPGTSGTSLGLVRSRSAGEGQPPCTRASSRAWRYAAVRGGPDQAGAGEVIGAANDAAVEHGGVSAQFGQLVHEGLVGGEAGMLHPPDGSRRLGRPQCGDD